MQAAVRGRQGGATLMVDGQTESGAATAHGKASRRAPRDERGNAPQMRAVVQSGYGAAPEDVFRLEQIARPAIGPCEVLVRVRAASVDAGTSHMMTGIPYLIRLAGPRGPRNPVPGMAVAGTVEAVGQNVTDLERGDEVFGTCGGSLAEYARARA